MDETLDNASVDITFDLPDEDTGALESGNNTALLERVKRVRARTAENVPVRINDGEVGRGI